LAYCYSGSDKKMAKRSQNLFSLFLVNFASEGAERALYIKSDCSCVSYSMSFSPLVLVPRASANPSATPEFGKRRIFQSFC